MNGRSNAKKHWLATRHDTGARHVETQHGNGLGAFIKAWDRTLVGLGLDPTEVNVLTVEDGDGGATLTTVAPTWALRSKPETHFVVSTVPVSKL